MRGDWEGEGEVYICGQAHRIRSRVDAVGMVLRKEARESADCTNRGVRGYGDKKKKNEKSGARYGRVSQRVGVTWRVSVIRFWGCTMSDRLEAREGDGRQLREKVLMIRGERAKVTWELLGAPGPTREGGPALTLGC